MAVRAMSWVRILLAVLAGVPDPRKAALSVRTSAY